MLRTIEAPIGGGGDEQLLDGDRIYLKPLNPNPIYEHQKMDETGRVIGVVRGMTFTQEFED